VVDERFDAWTRRRLGLVAGGAAVALLGSAIRPAAVARKGKRKRCRKLEQSCDQTKKSKSCCSSALLCAQVSQLGSGNFCCKQAGQTCQSSTECCGNNACDRGTGKCIVP
jgi:hypothetical protein